MTVIIQQPSLSISVAETGGSTIVINQESNAVEVQALSPSPILEFSSNGPQGAIGPQGQKGIELDEIAKIDGSIVYYHAASATFRADASVTKTLLTDGGNF